jgi:hypothetical protein
MKLFLNVECGYMGFCVKISDGQVLKQCGDSRKSYTYLVYALINNIIVE